MLVPHQTDRTLELFLPANPNVAKMVLTNVWPTEGPPTQGWVVNGCWWWVREGDEEVAYNRAGVETHRWPRVEYKGELG